MYFNSDTSKQAQGITFSKKNINVSHPSFYFNKIHVVVCLYQKHSGVFLDKKLNFNTKLKKEFQKQVKE